MEFYISCLSGLDVISQDVLKSSVARHMTNLFQMPANDYVVPTYELNPKLAHAKTLKALQTFLSGVDADETQEIPLYVLSDQILALFTQKGAPLGLKLCFSVYVRSLSLVSLFLIPEFNRVYAGDSSDKKLANKAIDMLLKTKLPPLFYPCLSSNVIFSVDLQNVKPVAPTAVATTETMLYIGCEGPVIKGIPLHRTQQNDVVEIMVDEFPNEPYSLVCQNGFLIMTSGDGAALYVDLSTKCTFTLPISYFRNPFSVLNKFSSPIVSDGELLYSISFPEAKIKTFKMELDAVLYVTSVKLVVKDTKLLAPFTEMLPTTQKNVCSIATNGVYISFVFRDKNVSICRTFLLRNGVHQNDVLLDDAVIQGWCFDGARPAHCVVSNDKAYFYNGCFTLPKWMLRCQEPKEDPKVTGKTQKEIIEMVSKAFAIFATRIIGSEARIPFGFSDECHTGTMEEHACHFIDVDNRFAAQAFLVFLGIRMKGNQGVLDDSLVLLTKLYNCYGDERYEYLQEQIAYLFLSSLDMFYQVDGETASLLLEKIMNVKSHRILLYRYLPKAQYLIRVLTPNSLTTLCSISLATTFTHDEEALSLLRELQFSFVARGESYNWKLFHIYVQALYVQFCEDYHHYYTDDWTIQRFVRSVSFFVLNDLVKLIRATCEKTSFGIELAESLFRIGTMPRPQRNEETEIIWETFSQCLFVSILVFVLLVQRDTSFYYFPDKEVEREHWSEISVEGMEHYGISDDLVSVLIDTITQSCLVNVTQKYVMDSSAALFHMIRSGHKNEADVIERCKAISKIQPQLMANIFRYLLSDDEELKVVTDISQCLPARILHEIEESCGMPEIVSMISFFVTAFEKCREHFCVIPKELLLSEAVPIVLRLYLPLCMFSSSLPIDASLIAELPPDQVVLIQDKLLGLASLIQNCKALDTIATTRVVCPVSGLPEVMHSIILLHVLVKTNTEFDLGKCECLLMKSILTSDYAIAYQTCLLAEELICRGFQLTRFLEFVLKTIGGYISGEENVFREGDVHGKSFRIVLLLAEHIRRLISLGSTTVTNVFRRLFQNKPNKSQTLAIFLVFSTQIDVPRLFKKVSFQASSGCFWKGKIVHLDDESFVIDSGESFTFDEVTKLTVKQAQLFKGTECLREFGREIKQAILEYGEVNAFQYACFTELIKISEFRTLWTNDEVLKMCRFGAVNALLHEFIDSIAESWGIVHSTLPDFDLKPLVPVIEVIPRMGLEQNLFGSKKRGLVRGILDSYIDNTRYVSTLVHPKSETTLVFSSLSDNGYVLMVYCISNEHMFQSEKYDIIGNAKVFVNPVNSCLEITCNETEHVFIIPPICDGLFICLNLKEGALTEYLCQTDGKLTMPMTARSGKPMQVVTDPEPLHPSDLSIQWRDVWLQDIHEKVAQLFSANMIVHCATTSCEQNNFLEPLVNDHVEELGLIIMRIMDIVDPSVSSYVIPFSHIKTSKANQEDMRFVQTVFSVLRQKTNLSSRFKAWLTNWISHEVKYASALSGMIQTSEQGFDLDDLPTPSNQQMATNDSDCAREIRHTLSILLYLSTSYKEFIESLEILKKLIHAVVPAAYLDELLDMLRQDKTCNTFQDETLKHLQDLFPSSEVDMPCVSVLFFGDAMKSFPFVSYLQHMLFATSSSSVLKENDKSVSIEGLKQGSSIYISTNSNVTLSWNNSSEKHVVDGARQFLLECSGEKLFIESDKIDDVCLRWRVFDFSKELVSERVIAQVFQWILADSHQVILSAYPPDTPAIEFWDLLPVSAVFSRDVVCFFIELLRRLSASGSPFFWSHTFKYDFELNSSDDRLAKFYELFPHFNGTYLTNICKCKDLSDMEKVGAYALVYGTHTEMPMSVDLGLCRKIGRSKSRYRSIFSRITGISEDIEIEPQYIRSQVATKSISADEVLSLIVWKDCENGQRELLSEMLKKLCSYMRHVFLDWLTATWGLWPLRQTGIIVQGSTTPLLIERHVAAKTLVIGAFVDQMSFHHAVMEALQTFINCHH